MKSHFLFTLILGCLYCNAQITLIPDPSFEQKLIDLNIDSDGMVNGQVLTSDIEIITFLDVNSSNINDLTGIEDFTALETLEIAFNNIEILNLSNNQLLETLIAIHNPLNEINLTNCALLNYIWLGNFDETTPNFATFTTIDLSTNISLETFECFQCSALETINFESNINLKEINITSVPDGANLNLTSINLKNGNNTNINTLFIFDAPNLICVQVDDATTANNNETPYDNWTIIPQIQYTEDCYLSSTAFEFSKLNMFPNPVNDILNIDTEKTISKIAFLNTFGVVVFEKYYPAKSFDLSHLKPGIYFIKIQIGKYISTKKIVKL